MRLGFGVGFLLWWLLLCPAQADWWGDLQAQRGYLSFPSVDGFKIYARFHGFPVVGFGRWPVVVELHGGPHNTFENTPEAFYTTLNEAGFLVLAVNYRGSRGYDPEYYRKDVGDPGGADVGDVVAAVKYLRSLPFVDSSRIFLMGHSYGGYLAHMTVCLNPGLVRGAICMSGPVDLAAELKLLEQSVRQGKVPSSVLQEMKEDLGQTDDAFLLSRSPCSLVDKVQTPLLIVHGTDDRVCPIGPIYDYVQALHKRQVPVRTLYLEGQGNDLGIFTHGDMQKTVLGQIVAWLQIL